MISAVIGLLRSVGEVHQRRGYKMKDVRGIDQIWGLEMKGNVTFQK